MKKLYLMNLTEDERDELRALRVRRDVRASSRRKAEALLQLDAGQRDKPVAQALGVKSATIQRWRTQFALAGSLAVYIEAGHLPMTLTLEAQKARRPDPRRRRVQKLAWHAKPLRKDNSALPPSKQIKTGNRSKYLAARIARDRPDVLDCMKQGEFSSMRAAAWAAGIRSAWREGPPESPPEPSRSAK